MWTSSVHKNGQYQDMTLGAFSTHLPTSSMMAMRYADIDAAHDLDPTRLADTVTEHHVAVEQRALRSWSAPSLP